VAKSVRRSCAKASAPVYQSRGRGALTAICFA
jgi:hypothetical protein